MRFRNTQQDVRFILSWFQEAFSSPSFKFFSSFVVGFIQLGKEGHTSSMVQSLARSFLARSLSSFTRFLGKNAWSLDEVLGGLSKTSSIPSRFKLAPSSFFFWTIRLLKRQERKCPVAPGVRITPRTWPVFLATNGFWRRSSINRLSCLFGLASTIPKGSPVETNPYPSSQTKVPQPFGP